MSDDEINPTGLRRIAQERKRQNDKLGLPRRIAPETWLTIAGQEFGEICAAVYGAYYQNGVIGHVDEEIDQLIATLILWREGREMTEGVS